MSGSAILSVRDLKISVRTDEGVAQILDHVNIDVAPGRIVGVAGESGCGKSTLIRAVLNILPRQTRIESGEILFNGEDLLKLSARDMQQRIRGRAIGFIPQDPYLALNPVFKVGTQLMEILRWHGLPGEAAATGSGADQRTRHRNHLIELLQAVQVPDPEEALERYPHQFSGGQRQRVLIAGALACQPELVLADEPTTALDVTTQLQILKLLKELAERFNVAMLFVTHDFGVIAQLCDSVSVMYAGQGMESGPTRTIINQPLHPYSQMLMRCHPDRFTDLEGIPGQVPSALNPPDGCRFHPRCPLARPECRQKRPRVVARGEQKVACVLQSEEVQ
jgi:peptide/nickel transport system ATP-binding protein